MRNAQCEMRNSRGFREGIPFLCLRTAELQSMVYNRQNLQILMFVYGFYCKFQLAETREASIFALKLKEKVYAND